MNVNTEQVWSDFHTQLGFFIKKRINNPHDAEDILQDVFVKIHKNLCNLKNEDTIKSWLYQLTRNTIIDYYRKCKLPTTTSDGILERILDESKFALSEEQDISPCVRTLINSLPGKYKDALIFTELEEHSQKELADELSMSVSGAKSRVQRARMQLKKTLDDCCMFERDVRGNVTGYELKHSTCSPKPCK